MIRKKALLSSPLLIINKESPMKRIEKSPIHLNSKAKINNFDYTFKRNMKEEFSDSPSEINVNNSKDPIRLSDL